MDPTTTPKFYFADRYCGPYRVPGKGSQKSFRFDRNIRPQELKALLSEFQIRMEKSRLKDVLPPLIREQCVLRSLKPREIKKFQLTLREIAEERKTNVDHANSMLMELVRKTMVMKIPHVLEHVKMTLDTHDGKFVCFVYHRLLGSKLDEALTEWGVEHIHIHGEIPMSKRTELLDQFSTNTSTRVAILSFGACGVGLNITCANLCLFCERIFDAVIQVQAEARCWRIGQTLPVTLRYLDLHGSTDTLLEANVNRKRATQAFLLGEEKFDSLPGPMDCKKRKVEHFSDVIETN
jgi:SNF2 family DNA or RNA helicase